MLDMCNVSNIMIIIILYTIVFLIPYEEILNLNHSLRLEIQRWIYNEDRARDIF